MHFRLIAIASAGLLCAISGVAQSQAALASLAGIYRLVTVDGHAIPFTPVHPGAPANAGPGPEVLASTMIVRPDGSFIMAMSYRFVVDKQPRFTAQAFSGRWQSEGDAYVGRWDGAGSTPLRLSGDTLVMNNEGMLFAYRRIR